jgi:O-antigen/teichoic acid export membrane protein
MIGWMIGDYYVGLYAVAVKLFTIVKQLLAAIYNVTMARMSLYYAQGNLEGFKILLNNLINSIVVLSIPATIGMVCISKEIILLICGETYVGATTSLQILSFALFFAVMGGMFASCINLPLKRERINLIATTTSAILNISLNMVLIPIYKQNGAALTTLASELTVSFILLMSIRDHYHLFDFKSVLINLCKSIISCTPIIAFSYFFKTLSGLSEIKYLLAEILCGMFGYFICNLILKNKWIYEICNLIVLRFRKKNTTP